MLILELSLMRVLLNPAGAVGFVHGAARGCTFPEQWGMLLWFRGTALLPSTVHVPSHC